MKELQPILKLTGMLLMIIGGLMILPAMVDAAYENDDWAVFAGSSGVIFFFGSMLLLSQNTRISGMNMHQAFLVVNLVWLVSAAAGAVPFVLSQVHLSFTDAFFESMSGITTTGSTVLNGLESLPPGILLWRAILQWIGGLGIIVTSISFFPALKIGGMQMFKVEAFDIDSKTFPQAAKISLGLIMVYLFLTLSCATALRLAGITTFEAITHAMTTVATGGFSTSDSSVGQFDNALVEAIITLGMVAGGIPFLAYVRLFLGWKGSFWKDEQIRAYLFIMAVSVLLVMIWLVATGQMDLGMSLRYASFNVVSIMTGTGFASTDYMLWGAFPAALLLLLTLIGGCAGSTACGMKVFRFQILFRAAVLHLQKLIMPSIVRSLYYKGMRVDRSLMASVQSFFYLFVITLAGLTVALTATGLDLLTSLSGAATAMANVGPGLGEIIGPSGTFQTLPASAKWLLSAGMLVGRLEVLTVYVLVTGFFWRG
jgi:trk system potassium uptake protein TrkH